jgi:DNA-binding CsgD family transcriptional regulator/predicted negative regulator of RcsB-dependent stress response
LESHDLLDRSAECELIDALLAGAQAGEGRLLLVIGPAGIGKSTLCAFAIARAGKAGMRVLSARGDELETGFSFGVVRQLYEPLLASVSMTEREAILSGAARRALIALEGEGGDRGAGETNSFAVIHGLYWLLVNAGAMEPLLVVVDDMQWADQPSMRALLYLADRVEGLPVALLVGWRTGQADEALDRLLQIAGPRTLEPPPLSPAAVRVLLERQFGDDPGEALIDASHAVTGGNPFLVNELVAALRSDRLYAGGEAAQRVLELGPRSVARSVSLRVARLGPHAGDLARAAAILGDGAQLRHAAALSGVELEDAAHLADRLAEVGLLLPGTPLRFAHAMVRTAVYDDIPEFERSMLHAQAAVLLAGDAAEPDQVCAHLLRCEPAGSPKVVQQLSDAASRALTRGAPEIAAAYLRRALDETGDRPVRLLHELGLAEKLMRTPAAEERLREALAAAEDPVERAEIAADLGDLLAFAGQWESALEVVSSELAGDLGGRGSKLESVWSWVAAYDPEHVDSYQRWIDELRTAAGLEDPGATTAAMLAVSLAWRGDDLDDARRWLERARRDQGVGSWLDKDPLTLMRIMNAGYAVDDHERLRESVEDLLGVARARGSVFGVLLALGYRGAIRARRGQLAEAEADIREVFELSSQHGLAFAIPTSLWLGVDALIERPGLADVAALAENIQLPPDLERISIGAVLKEVKGRLALARGDRTAAREAFQAAADVFTRVRLLNPNASCWRCALAATLDDPARARAIAREELDDARRLGFSRPIGIALRTLGALGDGEQAIKNLEEAVATLEGTYARLEHGRALVDLGAALRRSNHRAAAREPLRAGLDLAHRCGALRLAEHARVELLATGARPRRETLSGAEALTAAERRVAELAAQGLSNPEIAQSLFVTINTVEGHLRHVYQKLSISSRRQLPEALAAP